MSDDPETKVKVDDSKQKEILISGGKLTNVEGDYHEDNTIYVVKEAPFPRPNYFLEGQCYLINSIYS